MMIDKISIIIILKDYSQPLGSHFVKTINLTTDEASLLR